MPDLNKIPGFTELQAITRGDSRIKIAVLDGPADLDRACFQGGNISRVNGYWQQELEPIDPFYIQQELKIRTLSDRKKALKKTLKQRKNQDIDRSAESEIEASQVSAAIAPAITASSPYSSPPITTIFSAVLEDTNAQLQEQYRQAKISKQQATLAPPEPPATVETIEALENAIAQLEAEIDALRDSIPKPVQERLGGIFHATGIFGTMFGQPGSPVEGIAPYCTAINIPLFETATSDEALSPLNIAHAFNLALKLGVNIIHCAACHPTQTGFAQEMIQKAVKQCQDNNILIVAPSGNNKGEWFCAPAILPDVLAVGMMKDNGQPANYSNWGGQYQQQGILAPGENVIAAQPGTDEPARQEGTSLAAPVITGISALLMSVQLQRGEQPNAEAVRQALLNSAIPCNPEEVEEPERCLVGKLNIPGAFQLLIGEALQPSLNAGTSSFPKAQGSLYSAVRPLTDQSPFSAAETNFRLLNGQYALVQPPVAERLTANLYKAFDIHNQSRKVAIKLFEHPILKQNILLEKIQREKQALTELIHPRIIQLLDSGIDEKTGYPFLVLEWMDENLFQYWKQHKYKDWNLFYQDIALPVLEALAFCHNSGYVHRDLCSINVLRNQQGHIKLTDFGESRQVKKDPPDFAGLSHEVKQRYFQPPEPDNDLLPYARDVFTFGVFLIEGLADENFPCESTIERELQALDVPPQIHKLIARTIAINPEERPATASILLAELQKIHQQTSPPNTSIASLSRIPASVEASASQPIYVQSIQKQEISPSTGSITPSAASKLVYALGTIGYDFGDEARRDTFKQLMPPVEIDGVMIPANPYDASQMVDYLSQNPSEAKALIWTLNQELTPIYALEPRQGFSADIYETLIMMLAGQIEPEDSDNFVERVSIPAKTADKTVQLFSGQEVPVITIINTRGMYAWKINNLVEAALQSVASQVPQADEIAMRKSLTSFLNRVYFDFQNLGKTSKDRALNFSVTNAFQAASSFAGAVSTGMQLDSIEVEKSPFCRINSDCWDVILKFFDPENGRRAKKVYRFTVDVSDRIPVTLGEVRSWSVPK